MKISINNFKSIGSLANYEMRPLTILSGTNSSGKSSFIQLLLLLKQTLEIDSAQYPLYLDGRLYQIRNYIDILKGKNIENKLKVEFVFNKSELYKYKHFSEISFYDAAFDDYDLHIRVEFDLNEYQVIVNLFEIKFTTKNDERDENFIRFERKEELAITTDVAVFNDVLYNDQGKFKIIKLNYSAFVPTDVELEFQTEIINLDNEETIEKRNIKIVPKIDAIKTILQDFFGSLNYVGPLRKAPRDEYSINGKNNSVGSDGGNVAEVLYELSEKEISFSIIEETEETVQFIKRKDTFINAVKYWLCDHFKLCSDIYSQKEAESYVIYVISLSGVKATIKHVGFGISQILPIVVEGLRIKDNETFVLEQPELHLHPKVQSGLTDFLLSLVEEGKNVVIETHSDHLITRLRRRIAEDKSNKLDDKVLLTFVEVGANDVLFKNIDIDDFGVIELPYPENFIERTDIELKAILKAQMFKRLNQRI
ncbi:AAA family ATPase [Chryseobacterium gambrini]|uniref:AAA family ATPase n=1 Tax=Chryseobacterium gambrini TaxID=373672 RepID=A0ABM8KA72_9FLAO|nr:AAA family ATPase [Chryseobacterium gambrini]